ncbi:MAG: DUF1080 domain-containing protein, partial [Phycisphaerales bacterium]
MDRRGIHRMFVLLVVAAGIGLAADKQPEKEQWTALFDGKTLDNWSVHSGFAKYHVEGDAIVGTTVKNSPNTFLCTDR